MRDRLGAPLIFDQEHSGYRFDTADGRFELPGLWFTGEELHALVSLDHLLQRLQPGLLDHLLAPIRARLERILQTEHLGGGEAQKRIRILAMAGRAKNMRHFQTVAGAVLQRRRLSIEYYNRGRDQTGKREISPQRLTHYRDNWYLDAWCHEKKALRIFSVECIRHASVLTKTAKNVADASLNRELASAYVSSRASLSTAVLRFTAYRARWVADETWHGATIALAGGRRYELSVPYSRDTETVWTS